MTVKFASAIVVPSMFAKCSPGPAGSSVIAARPFLKYTADQAGSGLYRSKQAVHNTVNHFSKLSVILKCLGRYCVQAFENKVGQNSNRIMVRFNNGTSS